MGNLLDPNHLLETFGYIGLFAIVFAESGLLVGFFLPGDSLLFAAGLFTTRPIPGTDSKLNLLVVCAVCAVAAIVGDQVGYLIGRKAGPPLFRRPNSKIFKQKYVEKSQAFFDAHGSKTIVLARFVPIVRTFAPVIAGVGRMDYATFIRFNVIGGLLWGIGVPVAGHYLGKNEFIAGHVEIMFLIIVGISVVPVAFEVVRHWLKRRRGGGADTEALPKVLAED
ncbi:MAG: VTT domain-containing protein [Mycobacteriales bacterium]